MRERNIFLTLCLCLLSTFTLADNPTDAPLMNSDPTPTVNQKKVGKLRNCRDRKTESEIRKANKDAEASRRDAYTEQTSPETSSTREIRESR